MICAVVLYQAASCLVVLNKTFPSACVNLVYKFD